ncbi:MAG: hypothetical protein ACKO6D_13745 [Rubrivivax sp.]
MLIFRLVFGLLALCGILCLAAYIATGRPEWKKRGYVILKWTVLAALGFLCVILLERLARML